MPIYEYQCTGCQLVFEEWRKASEMTEECVCPQCGASATHILSQTAFVLKGGGWYVSDYGYRKNIKEDSADTPAASSSSQAPAPAASSDSSTAPAASAAVASTSSAGEAKTTATGGSCSTSACANP